MLQHTETLKLDSTYIKSAGLMDWYNFPAPKASAVEMTGKGFQVAQVDEQVLLNSQVIGSSNGELIGAAVTKEFVLIVSGNQLYWLTTEAEVIDIFTNPLPESILAVAKSQQYFQLQTPTGWFIADEELSAWQEHEPPTSKVAPVVETDFRQLNLPSELAVGISLERLLLDIHSGRILGSFGVFIMDLASLGLILLAATGAWLWIRRR